MREQIHNVQALRGVASLLVVLFHLHCWDAAFGNETPVFREIRWFGFAGVDLFFVLSGFVITASNRRKMGRPGAIPGYLFRRFWRIYPAYWAAMGLSAVVGSVVLGWTAFSPEAAAAWLALVPVGPGNAVIGQAWTLTFEVMFYVVFGILMFLPPRLAATALCGWAGAVVIGLYRSVPVDPLAAIPQSPFVFEFLGGCLIAWLEGRGVHRLWRTACWLGLGYAVAGIIAVATTGAAPGEFGMSPRVRVLVFGPPAVLIVYGLVAAEGLWPRRVPGWLLRTGDASYSLYLIHFTVMLMGVVVGLHIPHTRLPHLLWLAGTLAAALAVGFLFHALVERPLLNLAKGRRESDRPAARLTRLGRPTRHDPPGRSGSLAPEGFPNLRIVRQ